MQRTLEIESPALIILISKWPQSDKCRRLHELVLDPFSPANSKRRSDIVPNSPTVERPPLPSSILTSKALNYLPPAGMFQDVGCRIENDIIYHDDFRPQLSSARVRVLEGNVTRTQLFAVFAVSFLDFRGWYEG